MKVRTQFQMYNHSLTVTQALGVVDGNVVVNYNVGEVMVEGNVTEDAVEVKWLLSWSRATLARLWS